VFEHQHLEGLLGAAAGVDDLPQPFALLGQDFVLAAGLGLELGEDGRRLAFGLDAALGRLGLASTWILALSALAGASSAARRSASIRWASARRLGAGDVLGLEHGGLGPDLRFRPVRRPRPFSPASRPARRQSWPWPGFRPRPPWRRRRPF